nr:HAD family phosphatase [Propionicimonas sp.]
MPTITIARSHEQLTPPPGKKALLFDWDGTLFHNHHFNYEVMRAALADWDVPITEAWFMENSGYSAKAMVEMALGAAGADVDALDVLTRRDRYANDRVAEVPASPAVMRLLLSLSGERRIAVVTGSNRSNIQALLAHLDLEVKLDAIITRDQIEHGKPDPEGYRLALARLGVEPGEAMVYEDSDTGVEAAMAAGIDVIDVRYLPAA